jgi:uncharacterized protein (TIGR00369 family)
MADFSSQLGLVVEPDGSVRLETRPEHEVTPGTIHFAVLATLCEVAAAQAIGQPIVPVTLTVHLLRRATPGRLSARGRLLKRGRRLSVAEGEVTQGDRLVAKTTVTFAVVAGDDDAA